MGGGGNKGGQSQQTSEVKLPKWIESVAKENLQIADKVGKIGYVPYRGNTVAAFTPNQRAAMQNTANAASAFNMAGAQGTADAAGGGVKIDPFTGMAMKPTLSGGVLGYSPAAMYDEAKAQILAGQRAAIDSFFINPQTGMMGDGSTPFGGGAGGGSGGGAGGGFPGWGGAGKVQENGMGSLSFRGAGGKPHTGGRTGAFYNPLGKK